MVPHVTALLWELPSIVHPTEPDDDGIAGLRVENCERSQLNTYEVVWLQSDYICDETDENSNVPARYAASLAVSQ